MKSLKILNLAIDILDSLIFVTISENIFKLSLIKLTSILIGFFNRLLFSKSIINVSSSDNDEIKNCSSVIGLLYNFCKIKIINKI